MRSIVEGEILRYAQNDHADVLSRMTEGDSGNGQQMTEHIQE